MARTPSAETVRMTREAAARLLTERGPDGITVRAVARAAGVSPQSIYNRFGSQDALLDDVADAGYRQLTEAMLGHGPNSLTHITEPLDRLTEVFGRFLAVAIDDPNRHRFLFEGPMPWRSRRTAEARAEGFDLLVAVTRQAVDAGDLQPGDPVELTLQILAAALGAIRLVTTDDEWHPWRQQLSMDAKAATTTMILGLRPAEALSSGSRR